MYRYDADSRQIVCVSCNPTGTPPNENPQVLGSSGGRFISDDGRVFFDTDEALDPRDSNHAQDVYEFVDTRPQLITTGTGTAPGQAAGIVDNSLPGLYGVSGDGTDVYFGTFDRLVGQDRNGQQLKFYDARTNGGFPFVPAPAPCQAADECHGPSSDVPSPISNGTGARLGSGGNHQARRRRRPHKRRKRHRSGHGRNVSRGAR
jgi:hypothetical protein